MATFKEKIVFILTTLVLKGHIIFLLFLNNTTFNNSLCNFEKTVFTQTEGTIERC